MNKKSLYYIIVPLFVLMFLTDPVFCGITDGQIKAASKSFVSTISDWFPVVIAGGLASGGVLLFTANYKGGLSALAATGFLTAAKAYMGTGESALIETAGKLLGLT